jgi:putative flippase GtrA
MLKQTNPFIRFLCVGAINTVFSLLLIFILMNVQNVSYWTATLTGNTAGACLSFFLNRHFTFQSRGSIEKGALKFLVTIFICYFISYSTAEKAVDWLLLQYEPIPNDWSRTMAVFFGAGLYTMTNYLGQRWFVFREQSY